MYNNYSYNPYYQQRYNMQPQMMQPQQMPIEQPTQQNFNNMQRNILNGKSVESIDVVKAMDIPLDGSVSYFPIADGSAIVTKQLQMDGTSKTVVYKPLEEQKQETVKFATYDDVKKLFDNIDLSVIDDLKDEIKSLKNELKDNKKKASDK